MRKKIGRMLSAILASATLLSNSYIPVSAANPFTTASTSDTGTSSEKETSAGTADSTSGDTEQTDLTTLTLDSSEGEASVSASESSAVVDSATIASFDDRFDKKTFPLAKAPSKDEVAAELPETLSVTTTDGNQVYVPVQSWDSDDYKNSVIGDYTFTPTLDSVYEYSLASSIPWVNVCVTKNKVTDITTVLEDETCTLADAPDVSVIEEDLPTELEATVNDEKTTIKIKTWDTDYNSSRAGIYTFTPVIDELIYELDGTSMPYVVITVYSDESDGISAGDTTVDGKVTQIDSFTAKVASGAVKQTNGDYVWTPTNDSKGHQFVYRIEYSTSGQGTVDGNIDGSNSAWKITIPKTILKDKSGDRSDTYELSLPEKSEAADFSASEIAESMGFAYYEDGDNLVLYNFKPLDAAQNGYIEIAYVTKDRTYNYLDYGATGSGSSPFSATMTVSGLSKTTNAVPVYINTTASVNATYKYYPKQYKSWRDFWGAKPSDADDYVWQRWEIRTDITDDPTQTYNFTLKDEVSCSEVPVEVYGYKFSGYSAITKDNTITNLKSYDGYRYDYVFTRIKKTDWAKVTSYTIHNKITATVHPVDGVDADTTAVSTRDFAWTLPVFVHPTGHFYMWKYGNENWTNLFDYGADEWDYASYDLDQFQEEKITSLDNIKYAVWTYGYNFPWTIKDGGSSDNWQDYGYKNVTYQITDEAFYNLNADGTYGSDKAEFHPDYTNGWEADASYGTEGSALTPRMDPDDYDISYISVAAYYTDVPRDSDGHLSEEAGSIDDDLNFNIERISPTDKDVLEIYTKTGTGNYVKAGELNLGTGKYTIVESGLIKSIGTDTDKRGSTGDWRITFKDGVDGFRLKTSNNHYYTDLKIYPYVSIKNSDRVLNWTGTGKITNVGSTAKDAVLMRNVANTQVFDSSGNMLLDLTKTAGDRLRRSEKTSEISKKVVGTGNNSRKRLCNVAWKVNANETITSGNGESDEDTEFLPQDSGTFYDLLPAGATLNKETVSVAIPSGNQSPKEYSRDGDETYLSENGFTVETIDNYKNSGRTMLIVRVKDSGPCFSVYYTTVHSWDSIIDYGKDVTNPVAYETGNDEISGGFPDDPTALNSDGMTMDEVQGNRSNSQLSAENRVLFKNLDSSTDAYKFIYDEAEHSINAITAALSGLNKRVKSTNDSTWVYDTTVSPDETYAYRLRFANTSSNATKDIILYDSIEHYYKTDGAEKGESDWYGVLSSIDTSQMKEVKSSDLDGNEISATLNPVVYVSIIGELDFDVAACRNLNATSIWTKLTDTTDLSKVKAVAYDLRKDSAGNDFILKPGGSISSVLYMTAPHTVTNTKTNQYPETYNNVYLDDTVIGSDKSLTPYSIHYDYTTVRYTVMANLGVHKVSAIDTALPIKDISFRLYGTSDYGTEVNQILATDKNGDLTFKKIEKGSYILQEYSGTPDWLEDHTEHKVVIDGNGKVTIDGTDYTDTSITITNNPRIHADVMFYKRQDGKTSVSVNGATFMLSGTSYYGNDILMYASSEAGLVFFENVERGTYTIQETKAPENYVKSTTKYKMTVDANGLVSFDGLETSRSGLVTILNEKLHNFTIIKRSSYDNSPIAGAEFHLTGTSDYGTKVDMTAISAENGFAGFAKLEAGTYVLQETKTAEHHQLDTTKRVVRINSDGSITISGLNASTSDPSVFIWINERVPDEQVTVIKEWVGDSPEFTEDNMPVIHLVAEGADYDSTIVYFSAAARSMLDTNLATSFSRNTSLTETEVKEISGVQRID